MRITRFLFVLALTFGACMTSTAQAVADVPDADRQAALMHLLRQDCGACHGMRLRGGLGPALSAERFRDWSVEQLAQTILQGRPGTPMPPWQPFLTDGEARWLAAQLKRGVQQ